MADFKATKSSPTANSYATIDEADDFFELEYGADEWINLTDDTKEKLLTTATRMIDQLSPVYSKADDTQALNFPADNTDDGFTQAKQACIMQAFYLFQNADEIQEAQANRIQGLITESIGPVSRQISGFNSFGKYAPGVLGLLKNHIDLTATSQRG